MAIAPYTLFWWHGRTLDDGTDCGELAIALILGLFICAAVAARPRKDRHESPVPPPCASLVAPADMVEDPKFLAAFAAYVAAAGYSFTDFPGGLFALIPYLLLNATSDSLGLPRGTCRNPQVEDACFAPTCFVLGVISAGMFLVPLWVSVATWLASRSAHRPQRPGSRRMEDNRR